MRTRVILETKTAGVWAIQTDEPNSNVLEMKMALHHATQVAMKEAADGVEVRITVSAAPGEDAS